VTPRELRLATLARQLLLERAHLPVVDAVERLAGLQAQDAGGPYLGLAARLEGFRREDLTAAIERRELVVATLHRVTMHLVTAADHRWLKPTLAPLHEQTRRRPGIRDLDQEALLAEARRRAPVRMRDLRELAPGANPGHLNDFFQASLPFVRTPPAGTWGVGGSPVQELVEVGEPDPKRLVLSYLGAFGPATVADAQAWSGLTRLAPVFGALELDELGDGLYDLPGAPRPDEADVPVRFLPRYDNVYLAHADRSRFGDPPIGIPTVLVDGLPAATWERRDGDVHVSPFAGRLPRAVEAERRRLRAFLADG
jgi:hypothetical protein